MTSVSFFPHTFCLCVPVVWSFQLPVSFPFSWIICLSALSLAYCCIPIVYSGCGRKVTSTTFADSGPPSRAYGSSSGMSGMYPCVSQKVPLCGPVLLCVQSLWKLRWLCTRHLSFCTKISFCIRKSSRSFFFSFYVTQCMLWYLLLLCREGHTALSFEIQTKLADCQTRKEKYLRTKGESQKDGVLILRGNNCLHKKHKVSDLCIWQS